MEDNGAQTTKKSGFSFRKRRSNSKTRKSEEPKPVDIEQDEGITDADLARSGENSAPESGDSPPKTDAKTEVKNNEDDGGKSETLSSVEDASPKGVKRGEDSPEGPTKKKLKRKSRSLFRKSSKNSKNKEEKAEACEDAKKEVEASEGPGDDEKASEVCASDGKEQVECDDSGERSEAGEQSDGEYAGYASGAASEGELETGERTEDDDKDAETAAKKKGEQKEVGTKKKKFFKRGLSLRRSKSKKNGGEAKETDKTVTKEVVTCEIGVSTDSRLDLNQFAAQVGDGEAQVEIKENVETKEDDKDKQDNEDGNGGEQGNENEDENAIAKKAPVKPVRKVSFADHVTAESSDDGNSPSEETGEESQDAPPPSSVVEDAVPSELAIVPSEVEAVPSEFPIMPSEAEVEAKVPEDEPKTEVDDDELTEVSSVASSLLASLGSQETLQPSVFADTEETGSRVTLLESDEVGEGSGTGPEVDEKAPMMQGEIRKEKDGEWIMLDQSCDVSGELQRMRKQTLFSVKRLCCSIM